MQEPEIIIESLGGYCPVQAEGTVNGKPFYFRSRGDQWAMNIGGDDIILEPGWRYEEDYGVWPEAGWITLDEARSFIQKAAEMYSTRDCSEQKT